jgi:hypothetical protein
MSRKIPGSAIVPGTITLNQISGGLNDTTNASYAQANTARTTANDAYGQANSARSDANTTFATVNTTFGTVNTNYQAAYAQANTARGTANDAYAAANTKLSTSGGSISGDLAITGNLTVQGNATTINVTNLSVNDSMILLSTNAVGDSNDIGFIGHFDRDATATHAGLIRKATENRFYLFDNYEVEPTNNVIDVAGNNFRVGNLRLGIVNANSYVTAAGLDVTGQANAAYAAANNRVLKAGDTMTGQLNVSSGGLLVTGNVGIGTTNPGYALHAVGSVYASSSLFVGSDAVRISTDGSGELGIGYGQTATNQRLTVYNNTTAAFVVKPNGNVGIGTVNPNAALEVNGNIYLSSNLNFLLLGTNSAVNPYIQGDASGQKLYIGVNNGAAITIDSSKNIGIGTTNPSQKLYVAGGSFTVENTNTFTVTPNYAGTTGIPAGILVNSGNAANVTFIADAASGTANRGVNISAFSGSNWFRGLSYMNKSGTPDLILQQDGGNVGIGTTNPSGLWSGDERVLHLSSSGGTAAGIRISSVNATAEFFSSAGSVVWGLYSNTAAPFTIYTNASERLRIDSSGTMYLGLTGNPSGWGSAIKYAIRQSSASGYTGFVSFASGNDHAIAVGHDGGAGVVAVSYASGSYTPLVFHTGGSERIRIATSGEVGINSTSSTARLYVKGQGSGGFNTIFEDPVASGYCWIQIKATGGGSNSSWQIGTYQSGLQFYNDNNSAYRVFFGDNGNVGIGTTSPVGKLNVYVDADTNISIGEHPSYGAYNAIWTPSNDYVLLWQNGGHTFLNSRGSGDIFFREDNNTLMTILNGGNVGIGTASPTGKLHIYDTSNQSGDATLHIQSPSSNDWGIKVAKTGYDFGIIAEVDSSASYGISIYAGSSYVFRATGGGNLLLSGTLTESSSIELKENIDPITNALDSITKLVGVTYDRRDGSAQNRAGLIAESVAKVLPNVVNGDGIQYTNLIAYLVESIKELKAEIDVLKSK